MNDPGSWFNTTGRGREPQKMRSNMRRECKYCRTREYDPLRMFGGALELISWVEYACRDRRACEERVNEQRRNRRLRICEPDQKKQNNDHS